MSRQILLFSAILLVCTGVAIAPVQSEEKDTTDRQGLPQKTQSGGTYFH
ncbi:MAG: hypothetical protein HC799_01005 [Limnothrix sp. RL_2_0]|nr:hypothetical protein [Limnothrix sp. RL_2_0]